MLSEAVLAALATREPCLWLNDCWRTSDPSREDASLRIGKIQQARTQFARYGLLLKSVFPELELNVGVINSPIADVSKLYRSSTNAEETGGRYILKCDHALPLTGSVKARGGFYEILLHAEEIALKHGLLKESDDLRKLGSSAARELFSTHRLVVGSTGNLGLSIGTIGKKLGFNVTVHMSSDAKAWKINRLRALGADVVEHVGAYGAAVAVARNDASRTPNTYFVDDENSQRLFFGYSTAALELIKQLREIEIEISRQRQLFVYIPCGVGGAAGGITYGLRSLLGDNVHCFFAEPTEWPCMMLRLGTGCPGVSAAEFSLSNKTEADGLAVGQASEFVVPLIQELVSGVYTVRDEDLLEDLSLIRDLAGLRIEPSAAAGIRGPSVLAGSTVGRRYLDSHNLTGVMDSAVHVVWSTGGALLPRDEYERYYQRGKHLRVG